MRKRIPHELRDGIEVKYCKSCDDVKDAVCWYPLSEFNMKLASYDGLETKCKKCAQKKSAAFRQNNPEFDKNYQAKNSDKLKAYKREYYIKKKLEKV